jgi:hypothetical protein
MLNLNGPVIIVGPRIQVHENSATIAAPLNPTTSNFINLMMQNYSPMLMKSKEPGQDRMCIAPTAKLEIQGAQDFVAHAAAISQMLKHGRVEKS